MKERSSRDSKEELKKTVIQQRQIPGHNWGVGRSPSKISEEGKMVDTYRE